MRYLIAAAIVIGIVLIMAKDVIAPLEEQECITIKSESACNEHPDCYWEEEFEHNGRGPTGIFYCEDKPQNWTE